MATTGSIDVNLTSISNTINNTTEIVEQVTLGVADQSNLIGLAIGIFIAISLFVVLIFFLLGIIPRLLGKLRGLRGVKV